MNDYSIELQNISKSFKLTSRSVHARRTVLKKITPINDISFNVEKGKTIGIIGKNGCGKTTLLRLIGGILTPDKGKVITRGKIGPMLQVGVGSNDEFTVSENIIAYGVLLGFDKNWIKKKVPEVLKFAELSKYKDIKFKLLSSGMRVRIMFSASLLMDPEILLVDEILSVGDESFRRKSGEAFLSFKNRNKTIVLVSHSLSLVKKLCDEVYFLNDGKIVESGDPEKVIKVYKEFSEKNSSE